MKINISISKPYKKWNNRKNINKLHIKNILKNILIFHKNIKSDNVELSILLTDNIEIAKLNKIHRDKDKPTNILSFPDTDEILFQTGLNQVDLYLGDLALSYDKIFLESKEKNISFYNHFTHLCIHGILHLLGYKHDIDQDANQMESLEVNILKIFDIPTPY